MTHNVSIKDIAQVAGVSHTTISRALRNSPLISSEVREHIQQLAQDMGYVANTAAQSLKTNRTSTIGLVVTTIADPFVSRIMRGIEDVAQRYQISVFLSASYNDPAREARIIKTFHQRRVDGILIASSKVYSTEIVTLVNKGIPTVLIDQESDESFDSVHTVTVDDYSGAHRAVEYLTQLGHTCIGYIGAGNRPRSNRLRLQGYRDALATAGLQPHEEWVRIASPEHRYHTDDVSDGQHHAARLLGAGVTAIFCLNDMIAVGALMTCRGQGIRVPEQVSIIGFDDIELAQYVTPPLTTVHQPKLLLGQAAMEMLLDLLAGRPVTDTVLPAELVIRSSTARPSAS